MGFTRYFGAVSEFYEGVVMAHEGFRFMGFGLWCLGFRVLGFAAKQKVQTRCSSNVDHLKPGRSLLKSRP